MQAAILPLTQPGATFVLRLGPLTYRFESRSRPGNERLHALACHFSPAAATDHPDRTVLLVDDLPSGHEDGRRHDDPFGSIVHGTDPRRVCWYAHTAPELPAFRYQLPWALIIADIVRRGGAVAHAGLAARNGRGVLFLAPPGGGKSTTLATAPASWEVLSDDAALVWPEGDLWLASPLPSWTMMTVDGAPPSPLPFDPARLTGLAGLVVLAKANDLTLTPLAPATAAPHLYRSLTEYPATVLTTLAFEEHFFRCACRLARGLPCRRLAFPLGAEIWPDLGSFAGEGP